MIFLGVAAAWFVFAVLVGLLLGRIMARRGAPRIVRRRHH